VVGCAPGFPDPGAFSPVFLVQLRLKALQLRKFY
jgi:hypothetical protein